LRERMRVEVPIVLTGTSEGVGTYGGNLLHTLETLQIEALPLDIPPHVEVDVTPLATLESAVHVRDITLPGNLTILSDPDLMVVKVESPRVVEEEAAPAAEAAGTPVAAEEEDEEK